MAADNKRGHPATMAEPSSSAPIPPSPGMPAATVAPQNAGADTPDWSDQETFSGGPPRWLTSRLDFSVRAVRKTLWRALIVVGISWLPLLLLTLADPPNGLFVDLESLRRDIAFHARYLIAAPLLVIARLFCGARLGGIARHFGGSGLLDEDERARLWTEIARARRLVNSGWVELIVVALAYAIVLSIVQASGEMEFAPWLTGADGTLSVAGWWHILVSAPLMLTLLLGWFWRTIIWTLLLSKIARMNLRLIPAHPDRAAGLGFLTQAVRAYALVGMALGTVAAARFVRLYLENTSLRLSDTTLVGGTVLVVLLIAIGPLTVFIPQLARAWRVGMVEYGAMGLNLGHEFEHKWLNEGEKPGMLDQPDFSAAADLYQVIGNVQAIRFLPIDVASVAILVGATVMPFIGVILLSMPFDVVVQTVRGLLI